MPRKLTPEQAKVMLAKRQAEDPLNHYTAPVTLQRASECKARYICVHAPNRVGKTSWMQYIAASILRGRNSNWTNFGPCKILLVVPKRAQASKIWGDRLLKKSNLFGDMYKHPWIPKREIKHVNPAYSPAGSYPGFLEMKNGSTMLTILSGDPNSWKSLEGMDFDIVIRDEVAGNENLGDEIQPRLLDARTRHERGLQPWGGCVLWGATETKHNEEWLAFKQRCIDGAPDHCYFRPAPEEAEAYISMKAREEMRGSMSDKSYRIRGSGTLDAGDLVRIFVAQWDDKRHMLPQDHVIRPDDNLIVGWDPGVEHPTGMIVGCLSKDAPDQLKIVRCWEHTNESHLYDVEQLHQFLLGRRITQFVYDWAAASRHKHASSLFHEMIAAMEGRGYKPLAGYLRSDKRVEIGISTVRSMLDPNPYDRTARPRIVLNSSKESGCQLLRSEIMGYCKTEPTATSTGKIVKKNDDALDCFAAGTLIATEHGQIPIEQVDVGTLVWTRAGLRPVVDAWSSSDSAPVVTLTVDGRELTCTPGHHVWTNGRCWIPVEELTQRDTLLSCPTLSSSKAANSTRGSVSQLADSVTELEPSSIGKSGSRSMALFPTTTPSITLMETAGTTTSPTWNACQSESTAGCMALRSDGWSTLSGSDRLPPDGTLPPREPNGIARRHGNPGPSAQNNSSPVSGAAGNSQRNIAESRDSAGEIANPHGDVTLELMPSTTPALAVERPSGMTSTLPVLVVSTVTRLPSAAGRAKVYDLTVAGEHEFFANGVLVHNCLRYVCRSDPHWAAVYACGLPTYTVDQDVNLPPVIVPKTLAEMTPEQRREVLNRRLMQRNRASVLRQFMPDRRSTQRPIYV